MEREWILVAVFLDMLLGDPVYQLHPIRLMGQSLAAIESFLFKHGLNRYGGGILLGVAMNLVWTLPVSLIEYHLRSQWLPHLIWLAYWGFHCIALKDLLVHVTRIEHAARQNDLPSARFHTSMLVGRDTDPMDGDACCRAGLESLAENLVDGVLSPIFWGLLLGLPGILMFKVFSTMDSMVGYKNERYLQFGWFGARMDDALNYIPSRLSLVFISFWAFLLPGFSGLKALRVAFTQHSLVPGPNSGWSETAYAGALQTRLAGPIYKQGKLITEIWLGLPEDPPSGLNHVKSGLLLATAVTFSFTFVLFALPYWLLPHIQTYF